MLFRRRNKSKEAAQEAKVQESQSLLMTAAVETTQVAQEVTRTMQRRMEDAIRQFIATARIMNDALFICDTDGKITAFNPAAQRMFRMPDEPAFPISALFGTKEGIELEVEQLWSVGMGKNRSLYGIKRDNKIFPATIRAVSLDRSDGTTLVLLVAQDMTFVEKTLSSSTNGYAIVVNNAIVATNDALSRTFGYGHEELLGKNADVITKSKDRAGGHLDLTFEIATIQWEGEEAILITARQVPIL